MGVRVAGRVKSYALVGALTVGLALAGSPAVASADPVGTVISQEQLPGEFWIPGTADAKRITYATTGPNDAEALSTGMVFIPEGTPPPGGWPVISWAHGTVGLADQCAPSRTGPSERDRGYLATWMEQGYAIVATDYAGLGTDGGMPYLDGKVEAHNVVDMVKAGQGLGLGLSKAWVTIGQSQGGGAAITTARYATEYGPGLDYRGAVGTGVPAYIENIVAIAGPNMPPIALPTGMTAYGMLILAGLDVSHPELDLPSFLNDRGRELLDQANTLCLDPFKEKIAGTVLGDIFTKPLADIPNFHGILHDYMGMPEQGFDKPFFIGQGLKDTDIIMPSTLIYATTLAANQQPLTFRAYPTDHSGTMAASLPDTVPFVRALFDGHAPAPSFGS
ncbi:lipase family protein [Tomitella biformata]|uniref:lipase family protein n=1 Tax=Tomitella biformata TaxID=630403 RepID=UPI000466E8EC|nr:lipase family protein [Tomitella biformata]